ncbi:MAG: EAL domain-containing protein [Thalassotalea sp.]
MSNLARFHTEHWKKFSSANSLPQMSLSDFHQVSHKQGSHYQADYQNLTLTSALQPIYSIDHQRIIGYEALIRAQDHLEQVISPIELLRTPKKEVDNIYLDRLCRYLHIANFQPYSNENNWLFINVSAQASVKGRNYGLFFSKLLAHFNIEPNNVVVEIIEDPTTENIKLQEAAAYYKNMGCMLAIDDFGAGHSNFERVWNLKPDIVKLDRSLLLRAESSTRNMKMMSSLVDLLHQAGCLVVIEGVENQDQALISMDSGADFVQGYYFAKPQSKVISTNDNGAVFQKLTTHFIALQQQKLTKEKVASDIYRQHFRESILNLQQGLPFQAACQQLGDLPRSIRCFLTDELGEQIESTLNFQQVTSATEKFKQLKTSVDANWYRKHYIQNALKHESRVYVSSPYRSLTRDGLCITISMSFNISGKKHILCFDIMPSAS